MPARYKAPADRTVSNKSINKVLASLMEMGYYAKYNSAKGEFAEIQKLEFEPEAQEVRGAKMWELVKVK
ncbi:hypothetical protein SOPP22_04080 [Shewanella sp. OPT22]|nr:hypothetical protein SOPP22_04080 [Shewanella sp. OPT22]